MGLDMYLEGDVYCSSMDAKRPKIDQEEVKSYRVEIGYWRKHQDLHGFIVQTFAEGVDECQDIELSEESLDAVIKAVKQKKLPTTTGFFFGASDGSEDEETIEIFQKAKAWLAKKEDGRYKSIVYRASW